MSQYNQLPVYKAAYDLLLEVFLTSQTMKRDYRYSLGEELKKEMMQMMICVYRANATRQKEKHIAQAREHIETVKLQIRLLHDLKQLPLRNMAKFTLQYESISKQLAAWHKSLNKNAENEIDINQ